MVRGSGYRRLCDTQYKFEFCKDCSFYECELVGEYTQFRENHTQDQKEAIPLMTADGRCAGTVTVWSEEEYEEFVAGSDFSDAHSHSFDADALSYDQSTSKKNGCFMRYPNVYQVECGRKKVAEGIGDHYRVEIDCNSNITEGVEDRWEPLQPVFISAQTGQGKNYFVENILIPYVRELNLKHQTEQKVLILSNRLALKQQIKNRIDVGDNLDDEEDEEGSIYSYGEYADVMTYQSLLYKEKKLKGKQRYAKSRYIYVICDEAHFFTSDAMFNPHTRKILETIARLFQKAVRVYMSATPYECLQYIINCEGEERERLNIKKYGWDQCKWKCGEKMVFYHFKRNYSYLDIKTYSLIDELYEEIIKGVNKRNEKWLIFIDDKRKGARVKKQLEKIAEDMSCPLVVENDKKKVEKVYVVDANSKTKSAFQKIVKNEKLDKDTYVLISTSVLDNGINLKGIKNIVLSELVKTKCLQMVGRARVEGKDDRKNLYIKRFSDEEIEKRKTDLMKQQDAYGKYKEAYKDEQPKKCCDTYSFFEKYYNGNKEDWKNAKRWFGRTIETELYFNKIAESLVDGLIPYHQSIYDEMIDEKAKDVNAQDISHMGQKYLEYQLSWFGKKYCEDDDITFADKEKAKKEFIDFLEEYAEKGTEIVSEKEMNQFSKKFSKLFDAAFYKSDKNSLNYKALKMNRLLEKENIKYRIKGKAQVGPWTVVRDDT